MISAWRALNCSLSVWPTFVDWWFEDGVVTGGLRLIFGSEKLFGEKLQLLVVELSGIFRELN